MIVICILFGFVSGPRIVGGFLFAASIAASLKIFKQMLFGDKEKKCLIVLSIMKIWRPTETFKI